MKNWTKEKQRKVWDKLFLMYTELYSQPLDSCYLPRVISPLQHHLNNALKNCLELYKPKIVLDVGCGVGNNIKNLIGQGCFVVGIDISPQAVKAAAENTIYFLKRRALIVADAENLPFRKELFDLVVFTEIIEHLTNPTKSISEIHRLLKRQKGILLSTRHPIMKGTFVSYYKRLFPSAYRKECARKGHDEMTFFSMNEITQLLKAHKLIIKEAMYVDAWIGWFYDVIIQSIARNLVYRNYLKQKADRNSQEIKKLNKSFKFALHSLFISLQNKIIIPLICFLERPFNHLKGDGFIMIATKN